MRFVLSGVAACVLTAVRFPVPSGICPCGHVPTEIFGPVLSVVRAKDYEEAVRLPSEHEYGNGVAIFTRDGDAARDFVSRVEVGMVGVNFAIPVPAYYTFGGWKRSGFGDPNQHGPDAMRFYTKTKTVTAHWPSGVKEGAEFVIPTMK
jgi:malonate-semialdehyde dehydrogenase (acetylating)/methylmalonate-semialdehyde dehydrogenase